MRTSRFVRAAAIVLLVAVAAPAARAGDKEFDLVVKQIKTQYNAKSQQGLPFIARIALKFVKPAGLKSIKVTTLEGLSGIDATAALGTTLREKLGPEWTPLVRAYSRREREQTFVYVRVAKKDLELLVVAVDDQEATVVKAKVDPKAAAKWADEGNLLSLR